jgi:hypothetical protein
MQYMALLYGVEDASAEPDSAEWDAEIARYGAFEEGARDAIVTSEALEPSRTAVTVRPRPGGEPLVTDGPFAETVEVLGGYYVLEAPSLDEAVAVAARIPAAADATGAVELRPLAQWFDRHAEATVPEGATRWLALLHAPASPADVPGTPEWDAGAAEHEQFGKEVGDALLAGAALHPATTATTVREREGEVLLSDGPFAETAEVLGGLYVWWARTRDEAVALAAKAPVGERGAVELRPLVEFG